MIFKKNSILISLFLLVTGTLLVQIITSCGKQGAQAGPTGLNIQYEVLNLSPDLNPVNLFIDFKQVNTVGNPFVFTINHGYFYVPSVILPYQFRSNLTAGQTIFSRNDSLKSGLKYSLFIVGALADNSLTQIFTIDSASSPKIGHGKLRFVNASPTAISGLDVSANETPAFSKVTYKNYSKYIELPVGNYDLKITATGNATVLKELQTVTIQDGRLYTLFAYGYTSRADSAAFNAAVLTNK